MKLEEAGAAAAEEEEEVQRSLTAKSEEQHRWMIGGRVLHLVIQPARVQIGGYPAGITMSLNSFKVGVRECCSSPKEI